LQELISVQATANSSLLLRPGVQRFCIDLDSGEIRIPSPDLLAEIHSGRCAERATPQPRNVKLDTKIAGKIALICGGSSGIGLACALALAAEGTHVRLVARNKQNLESAASIVNAVGGQTSFLCADLGEAKSTKAIYEAFPEVDILVTNPGVSPAGDLLGGGRLWSEGIDQIVTQPLALIDKYLPRMQRQGFGRVINITSSAVMFSGTHLAFSGALRSALTHAAASLAKQVAARGVTVNNVAPGPVESEGLQRYFERIAAEEGVDANVIRLRRLQSLPSGRFISPSEIGFVCVFLASPCSSNINGRTILVDGGANPNPFI
jgi:3-oxoacyl-[acyl-carrier protein] reductase